MSLIAKTPHPPYYALIFTSCRTEYSTGYSEMSSKMRELAVQQPGFLGIESARVDVGITVSYWSDLDSISAWKTNIQHLKAQESGRTKWYSSYKVRITKVEHDYDFSNVVLGQSSTII